MNLYITHTRLNILIFLLCLIGMKSKSMERRSHSCLIQMTRTWIEKLKRLCACVCVCECVGVCVLLCQHNHLFLFRLWCWSQTMWGKRNAWGSWHPTGILGIVVSVSRLFVWGDGQTTKDCEGNDSDTWKMEKNPTRAPVLSRFPFGNQLNEN